jgi:ABC-type glycerol-3-phosphate transport system substrate-binding protein
MRTITRRALGRSAAGGLLAAACGAQSVPTERSPIEGIRPGGKITWAVWAVSQEIADNYHARLREFMAQYPGIQVEILWTAFAVYRDKIVSLLSAGTPPELLQSDSYWMAAFVQQGALQQLDPYIRGDKDFKLDAFLPGSFLEHHHVFKGVHFGIPNGPESPRALFYSRTKWLQNGLPLPNALDEQGRWTWDTFVEHLSRVATGSDPERSYGIAAQLGFTPEPHSWIYSNNGKSLSDDLKTFVGDQKDTLEALQFQADLIHKHRVAPKPGVNLGTGDTFLSGRMAVMFAGIGNAAPLMARPDFDYGIVALPRSPKGIRRTVVKPNALTIPVGISGQRAATAWELAKYMTGFAYQKGQIDAGQALTNRKDQVDYFSKNTPVKNGQLFMQLYDKKEVLSIPLIPKWIEYSAIATEELNKVRSGEVGVPAAVGTIKARVNELLRS